MLLAQQLIIFIVRALKVIVAEPGHRAPILDRFLELYVVGVAGILKDIVHLAQQTLLLCAKK